MYCANDKYRVAGNYLSSNFQYVLVRVAMCKTGCKPTAVIRSIIEKLNFSVVLVNSYLDFEYYVNPIKTFLDDRYSYKVSRNLYLMILIMATEVIIHFRIPL